tara:strand:- start:4263 stop:5993 length:1731 start_codon:yes stop_codon:yes gene_type:complete
MEVKIPEIEAKKILETYQGANNYILGLKDASSSKYFKLSRGQANYIIEHQHKTPKVARKWVDIDDYFANEMQKEKLLTYKPTKIYVEKILTSTIKAYHIWGKLREELDLEALWIPKSQLIPNTERKVTVDYTPFSHRPPMEHQKKAIEKLLGNDKFILADDMGLGKTTSAVIASIVKKSKKTLIVCPASLKLNWKREIENYSDELVGVCEGKKWQDGKYVIINYDILKNFYSEEEKLEINPTDFDLIIIDEAHYISNPKAKRTKIINSLCRNLKYVWLLTGTPMTSRPINYFNILRLVGSRVSKNWVGYVTRYCDGKQFSGPRGRKIWNVNGASNLDELRERTSPKVLRRLKEDILDLPDKIITPIYLNLKSREYEKEMGDYIDWMDGNQNKSLAIQLSKLTKVRQIIAREKLNYTCELIDQALEQEKKVIVFTNFTAPLDEMYEKYKKIAVKLNGTMKKEDRQESVDRFQKDKNVKLFIANLKAGGVGITLTAGEVVIMNDLSFVPSDHSQAEDRAFRIGQKNSVSCMYPLFENTIEQIVYNILQNKKNVIDAVMGDNLADDTILEHIMGELYKM